LPHGDGAPAAAVAHWRLHVCRRRQAAKAERQRIEAQGESLTAADKGDQPGAAEFLDRMRWLPELLQVLDQPVPLDG
jgi:hypothetical protein